VKLHIDRDLDLYVWHRKQEDPRLGKPIKELAAHCFKKSGIDRIVVGMLTLAGIIDDGPEMTVVKLSDFEIGVFHGSPEDERDLLEKVQLPAKKPVPEKVAVKMVLLRVRNLMENHKQASLVAGQWPEKDRPEVPPRLDVHSRPFRQAVLDYGAAFSKIDRLHHYVRDSVKDLVSILDRDDVTDAAVEKALEVALVEEVMKS